MNRVVRNRWKSVERQIAEHLGGRRVPVSGRTRGWAPDIDHEWLAIEVKSRKAMLQILATMMDQAKKAAIWAQRRGKVQLPIGVYHVTGTHIDNAYVFMRLGDFCQYFLNERPELVQSEDEAV